MGRREQEIDRPSLRDGFYRRLADCRAIAPYEQRKPPYLGADHRRKMTAEERPLFGIEKLNVPRSDTPAITHMDYSARIQTVHEETNPRYYALL